MLTATGRPAILYPHLMSYPHTSHYAERVAAMEHRYLLVEFMLSRVPACEVLFICSEAPSAEVV
jgi:hypothetical protein